MLTRSGTGRRGLQRAALPAFPALVTDTHVRGRPRHAEGLEHRHEPAGRQARPLAVRGRAQPDGTYLGHGQPWPAAWRGPGSKPRPYTREECLNGIRACARALRRRPNVETYARRSPTRPAAREKPASPARGWPTTTPCAATSAAGRRRSPPPRSPTPTSLTRRRAGRRSLHLRRTRGRRHWWPTMTTRSCAWTAPGSGSCAPIAVSPRPTCCSPWTSRSAGGDGCSRVVRHATRAKSANSLAFLASVKPSWLLIVDPAPRMRCSSRSAGVPHSRAVASALLVADTLAGCWSSGCSSRDGQAVRKARSPCLTPRLPRSS